MVPVRYLEALRRRAVRRRPLLHRPPVRHVAALQKPPVSPLSTVERVGLSAAGGLIAGPIGAMLLPLAAAPINAVVGAIGDVLSGPSPQAIIQQLAQQLPKPAADPSNTIAVATASTATSLLSFLRRMIP